MSTAHSSGCCKSEDVYPPPPRTPSPCATVAKITADIRQNNGQKGIPFSDNAVLMRNSRAGGSGGLGIQYITVH